jgi:hypothetical protein
MRSFGFLALAVAGVALFPTAARADEASDLVAKNLAARGGAAKLAAISSIQFTGKAFAFGGIELGYQETLARHNGAVLFTISIQGLTIMQGYDGKVGWKVNPFEGRRDAERMSQDDTLALAEDGTIDGRLLASKETGATITYAGREDFDGTDAYKLRVDSPSGAQYTYYLDPDTYLEIKVLEARKSRGALQVQQIEYGDYELVNGVYFPFEVTIGPVNGTDASQQKLIIAKAVANVPVTDATFAMPAAPKAK